jgi:hypothetical protein
MADACERPARATPEDVIVAASASGVCGSAVAGNKKAEATTSAYPPTCRQTVDAATTNGPPVKPEG